MLLALLGSIEHVFESILVDRMGKLHISSRP
jgi:hypothetical protein